MRKEIVDSERIVVKIGSSTLTYQNSKLNLNRIEKLIRDVVDLKHQGKEVILVSSGAIAAGVGGLNLEHSPETIPQKQALAAIGQGLLMKTYQKLFSEYDQQVAQVLLTQKDLTDRKRYLNSRNTLNQLLEYDVIPIVNENDTIAVNEIKFGDNDTLSALVSGLVDADLLVVLSDIDGLYTADPRSNPEAEMISQVEKISKQIEDLAGTAGTERGTGGMVTKIRAAKIATKAGISLVIANGSEDQILSQISSGQEKGTLFSPQQGLASREKWIAFNLDVQGDIIIDSGAAKAIDEQGSSLLPCGVVRATGRFKAGDVVDLVDEAGNRLARGLVNYSQSEVEKIKGLHSSEIKEKLGYQDYDEIIHRNNLVRL
ncbi:glutamate 5-kinase [Natroniella sulfidigena]|uniref:glutamate 5-kinase n=1 Tax=Natroniella sulfidigena TaxID=723921 RepID=UPI00200A71B7|nr:glutamate 5-kinase [Natroniella sulfidigena]MCK8815884.1 glutamate 5-kinase [Natroniella sulfidigena]